MLKGIVFDLDGTLVDSLSTTFDAFNNAITQLGGRTHSPDEIMSYFGTGEDRIFAQILGEDKAARAYELCCAYTDQNLKNLPLFEGVGALLEGCKSSGVPLSIFTGRSWNTTEMILKHHRLLDRFVTVVANDHVSAAKPSPEGLLLALKRMKLAPDEVLFVGDSPADVRAAHGAGSRAVAAMWDEYASREKLAPHHPHHWAEKPSEVWQIWLGQGGAFD